MPYFPTERFENFSQTLKLSSVVEKWLSNLNFIIIEKLIIQIRLINENYKVLLLLFWGNLGHC
jgi:branched-subunit amino acid transport protein